MLERKLGQERFCLLEEHRKRPSAPWVELAPGPYIMLRAHWTPKPWQAPFYSSYLSYSGAPALPFHKTVLSINSPNFVLPMQGIPK